MQWDQQWCPALTTATDEFASVLASSDLAVRVPGCPGWSMADLAGHLGGIHQWAAHAVQHGTPDGEPTPAPADQRSLTQWYRDSARHLIDVLGATPPDAPAWTFGPHPRTAAFWRRRQVHETQMHLHDALSSQGGAYAFDPATALDGLDEVVTVFFPRQVRLQRTPPVEGVLQFVADDANARLTLGGGTARATVSGPAGALLELVWKRIGPDDVRLTVTGDQAWATSVLGQALTP